MAVSALALTLAWVVVAAGYHHLSFSNRNDRTIVAQNLAESVVSLAISKVMLDPNFGTIAKLNQALEIKKDPETYAWLAFAPQVKADETRPTSTNNLLGDNSLPGFDNRLVPAQSVHLVGIGRCGSVERRVEALLHIPPFPYSIACQGTFKSDGGLLVASVNSPDSDELLPGHLLSNAISSDAVSIGPDSQITGDLVSSGGVKLDKAATVKGEVRTFQDPSSIPQLNVEDYDPSRQGKPFQAVLGPILHAPTLSGFVRRAGDLIIYDGLRLDGGVLFVEGNLEIDGGIRGVGAIFVTGSTRVLGGSAFSSDNQAAIVSKGDLTVLGEQASKAFFQGLVYTDGALNAEGMTLIGSLISRSAGTSATIRNSSVLQYPPYSEMKIERAWTSLAFVKANGAFVGAVHSLKDPTKVVYDVSASADGSFALMDPKTGWQVQGLTQEQTLTQLAQLVIGQITQPVGLDYDKLNKELTRLTTDEARADAREEVMVDLDLNRFLPLQEQVRILYWRNF